MSSPNGANHAQLSRQSSRVALPREVTSATGLMGDLAEVEATRFLAAVLGLSAAASLLFLVSRTSANRTPRSRARFYAVRLHPGEEIKAGIARVVTEYDIRAGSVVSCVGSTATAKLRLANASADFEGCFLEQSRPHEIVSLSGTVSVNGSHLHISLADESGNVFGGHLCSATVNTTCELVIADLKDLEFTRPHDKATGFGELNVSCRNWITRNILSYII